jgi:uncharacterized protein with GYD domain
MGILRKGGILMATYLMFGRYSSEAVKGISSKRTQDAVALIKKFKGEVNGMYATLGENDLVFVLTFPGMEQAMKASVALSKMTGIAFSTSPAVSVEEFDKLLAGL